MCRIHALDRVAEGVAVGDAAAEHRGRDAEDGALPGMMEDRLVGLDLDAAEAVDASHVVDAVHVPVPSWQIIAGPSSGRRADARARSGWAPRRRRRRA